MTPADFKKLVLTNLNDIWVAGFLDPNDSQAQFYPQLRLMFLKLGEHLWELSSVEDTGTMKMSPVESFSEPDLDEDWRPCVMSIDELVLNHSTSDNRVVLVRLWGATFSEDGVVCSAAQFELDNGQVVFIDPTYFFGMRIGGLEQRANWFENWGPAATCEEWNTSQVM